MIQYRVKWSAFSNINFRGESDWLDWEDDEATADEVSNELSMGGALPQGLEEVIEWSGLEWDVETREAVHVP